MIINKVFAKSVRDMQVSEVCSYYKFLGIKDQRLAYDAYLVDSGLQPACDAKDFHKEFTASKASDYRELIDFTPNVFDLLVKSPAMVSKDKNTGIWYIVWQGGNTGTFPPCCPPDPERFIPVSKTPYDYISSNDHK